MEEGVLQFLFDYVSGLGINNCDIYTNRPTIIGDKENRGKSYVIIAFPNGFEYMGAFSRATGMITVGAKDRKLGLPNVKEITRISDQLRGVFPILTDDYSVIDFEFSSDHSEGTGWHEYYYTFQIYINKSN